MTLTSKLVANRQDVNVGFGETTEPDRSFVRHIREHSQLATVVTEMDDIAVAPEATVEAVSFIRLELGQHLD